jgi:GNAT superfamily N-acetyltransferase
MATIPAGGPLPIVEYRHGDFHLSSDRALLDLDLIHNFLTNCYWAKGIPKDTVARSIEHSLCFGIYDESDARLPSPAESPRPFGKLRAGYGERKTVQVGFARVISDFATIAYLGDVFVVESHRGRGLGKWLMECIMQHPALQGLRRWILLTRDAHDLYATVGFTPLKVPERYMELHRADIYEKLKAKREDI